MNTVNKILGWAMSINRKYIAMGAALGLTILFLGIVSIERLPGVLVTTETPYEWLMFGTFKISLLDDITHGISGLLGLAALILGYRWVVLYLMLIGGYYALDALFFVVNGFATGQGLVENFLLNGPHIGITILISITLLMTVRGINLRDE